MTRDTDPLPSASWDARAQPDEVQRCRLCGGDVAFALCARDRARPEGEAYAYVACVECGSLQLERLPTDLAGAYAPTYYTRRQRLPVPRAGGWLGWRRARTRLVLRLAARPSGRRLARALAGRRYGRFEWLLHTATGPGDTILDVGCGSGRLLFRMAADGFRRLVGIDPALSDETVAHAAGRPGLRFERVGPEAHAGAYHLVMAHHSFEHMAAPRSAFASMAALVAPGGWLLLRVPLADSWAFERHGADWAQLDAPRHLQIPTRRAIERLARDYGLVVDRIVDDSGPFQILGSGTPLRRGARFAPWRALGARLRARALRRAGRGDQAAFFLRKPGAVRATHDPRAGDSAGRLT